MKALIERFWVKYSQLQFSVNAGDDVLIDMLDREIEPVLETIFSAKAGSIAEAKLQFQLLIDLLRHESDDVSCVVRHSGTLQALVSRYFNDSNPGEAEGTWLSLPRPAPPLFTAGLDEGLLNEAILDCLPDRIAVVTPDYRYLYTNPVNASRLDHKQMELVGRHIVEFMGIQRFEQRVKPHLDRCFAGECVDYTFSKEMNGRTVVVRCRMNPCKSSTGKLIGAIVVLQEIADRRRAIAA